PQRAHRLQVPRRLEQPLPVDLHRAGRADCRHELAQCRGRKCGPTWHGDAARRPAAPGHGAEPVHELRRNRIVMASPHRPAGGRVNSFSLTEQTFFTGTASQTGTTRWGDYSAMTLDPDGCTFWYTNEYANPADQTFNHRWLTKFGSFGPFPGCTPVGAGGT